MDSNNNNRVSDEAWESFWEERQKSLMGHILAWGRRRFITQALIKFMLKNMESGSILEAGRGTGEATILIAKKRNDKAILVDRSERALAIANCLSNKYSLAARLVKCDILELSKYLAPKEVDIVWNTGVIEHFPDVGNVLNEMALISRHYCVAIAPERSLFWLVFIKISFLLKLVPNDFFIHLYSGKELTDVVSKTG